MSEINLPPFYLGQKVVATGDIPHNQHGLDRTGIHKGTVLTVRKCYGLCVFFNEIINNSSSCFSSIDNGEPAYHVRFFAPVQENFQSITLEKCLETETPLISVN